jgi:hypothetical protein
MVLTIGSTILPYKHGKHIGFPDLYEQLLQLDNP